jgi:hypothetical protein
MLAIHSYLHTYIRIYRFPNDNFSPYKIPEGEADLFLEQLEKRDALARAAAVGPIRTSANSSAPVTPVVETQRPEDDDTDSIKVYGG